MSECTKEPFKPGDVVQLKSGGPLMTVKEQDGDCLFCVFWNQDASQFVTLSFDPVTLQSSSGGPVFCEITFDPGCPDLRVPGATVSEDNMRRESADDNYQTGPG